MDAATKTFPVAADAYPASNPKSCLTHACLVDADGFPIKVLCRVKLGSIMDDTCVATDDAPTCPTCARRLAKLAA